MYAVTYRVYILDKWFQVVLLCEELGYK